MTNKPPVYHCTLPARQDKGTIVILSVMMVIWIASELTSLRIFLDLLADPAPDQRRLILFIIWLVSWTVAGLLTLKLYLWVLFGVESIEISEENVRVKRSVLGIAISKTVPLLDITKARYDRVMFSPWPLSINDSVRLSKYGCVLIVAGKKKVRFGIDRTAAEVAEIVQNINDHRAALKPARRNGAREVR